MYSSPCFDLQDDIIDEVSPLIAAARCLKEKGATKVYAVATHSILPENTPELLEDSCIDQVLLYVTSNGNWH